MTLKEVLQLFSAFDCITDRQRQQKKALMICFPRIENASNIVTSESELDVEQDSRWVAN